MHAFRLGKAPRATNQPLHPGPEMDGLALDVLPVLLADLMLLGIDMPLSGPPAVGVKLRDAQGLQELLSLEEDGVFASSEHIRQPLPGVVIHGVPEPARRRFRLHKTPHCVELGAQPTTHLKRIRAPAFHLALLRMQERQHPLMHWL